MIKIGILGSTRGTVMLPLIYAIHKKQLNGTIEVVISNKSDAIILQRAKLYNLPYEFLDPKLYPNNYDEKLSDILKKYQVDLVVLIGYMRILSNPFINEWRNKIINIHPALLPKFAGKMDKSVHQAVLEVGEKTSGCTVHWVTEDVDAGPILIQKKCPVLPQDTIESLKERIQSLEGEALIESINVLSQTNK